MRYLALLLLLIPSPTLATSDPLEPKGLFECRSKEGTKHRLEMSELGFVPPSCPSAPAILVTDEGSLELGMPFAEVAKRLELPGDPAGTALVKNLGTDELPNTFAFFFDEKGRLYSVMRGLADHVADQLAAYWGPAQQILGGPPTRAWFNPRTGVRATLVDRSLRLEKPRDRAKFDGHRYILELRTYLPVRELFGPRGFVQRGLLGRSMEEAAAAFPELQLYWSTVTEDGVTTKEPRFAVQPSELDGAGGTIEVELVDGKISRARWSFGLGDAATLTEILAEIHRAVGGTVVDFEAPSPEALVATYRLPTGALLKLSSGMLNYSYGGNREVNGSGALWHAELRNP